MINQITKVWAGEDIPRYDYPEYYPYPKLRNTYVVFLFRVVFHLELSSIIGIADNTLRVLQFHPYPPLPHVFE